MKPAPPGSNKAFAAIVLSVLGCTPSPAATTPAESAAAEQASVQPKVATCAELAASHTARCPNAVLEKDELNCREVIAMYANTRCERCVAQNVECVFKRIACNKDDKDEVQAECEAQTHCDLTACDRARRGQK